MKTEIENAIKTFLANNNYQIEVNGTQVTFLQSATITYISSVTSSPYTSNKSNIAIEWEKEYQQAIANGAHSTFEADIIFEIDKVELKTTMFGYRFVNNPDKIIIDTLICTKI